ncbi:uncharacterized protein LOC106061514 [Biomphalaria glabrata]|uniref:Uncharacterized protein LOC106061514 n=1 Tax=Biomphalaria glabrata TaxID=6526 RepID=A0A9W3BFN9_BIOGL|nr:uncharacterized protein LOC106061514 [Biomphalaria glabrata]
MLFKIGYVFLLGLFCVLGQSDEVDTAPSDVDDAPSEVDNDVDGIDYIELEYDIDWDAVDDYLDSLQKRDFWGDVAKWAKIAGDVATAANGRDVRRKDLSLALKKRDFWEDVAKWAKIAGDVATAANGRDVRRKDLSLALKKRDFWEDVANWAPGVAAIASRDVA